MEKLPAPINRYLTGRRPSHSGTSAIADNFTDLDPNALKFMFHKAGWMSDEGKPTKQAVADGLIDTCEKKVLWKLDAVSEKLTEIGYPVERKSVNQEIKDQDDNGEPRWVNLGTIGTYFNVTANTVGKWLDKENMRDDEGMPSENAFELGLATVSEMNAGGKKTRKIAMWNLYPVQRLLLEAGHELDFDYEKTLKGKGQNSDVQVTTVDDRAREFAREFTKLFKDPATRKQCAVLVQKTPKMIQSKGEALMKKPGFITNKMYLKYLK